MNLHRLGVHVRNVLIGVFCVLVVLAILLGMSGLVLGAFLKLKQLWGYL